MRTTLRLIAGLSCAAMLALLAVNTSLEDLAGNRVGRAFDVDTFREVTPQLQTQTVSVPFRIGHE